MAGIAIPAITWTDFWPYLPTILRAVESGSLILDRRCTFGYFNDTRIGGIAQLGERLDGIEKVRGSSPLASNFVKAAMFTHRGLFNFKTGTTE